ncbi:MAG: hypothetical protein H6631_09710 [Anaerolineaceae bacterium]|nr:hypothetical protein [Anaerolineaceae bacterium]MCB9100738.1 hypothetical protein [Anaerolineales bacterium]
MTSKITAAYITTVRPDHTIVLPEEMAVGSTVAVVVLPPPSEADDAARRDRFNATLNAVSRVSSDEKASTISDEQLSILIKKAIRDSSA